MAGKIKLITLGGTLLMKKQQNGSYAPFYHIRDALLIDWLKHQPHYTDQPNPALLAEAIIQGGEGAYVAVGHYLKKNLSDAEARDEAIRLADQQIALAGFDPELRTLPFDAVDSINLDIKTHYPELRKAILETLEAGDVPVVAGGTDTLRYYGSLIAEDIAQLKKEHHLGPLPPTLLLTSMRSLEENPDHVIQLIRHIRPVADQMVADGQDGVYALLPDGVGVKHVTLLDMAKPCDKISGHLDKAFVGTESKPYHYAPSADGGIHCALPIKASPQPWPKISPFQRLRVAPPLEASNGCASVTQFLRQANGHFDAIIIKGALNSDPRGDVESLQRAIAELGDRNIPVFFVNDPVESHGKLTFDRHFKDAPLRPKLEAAGGIFLDRVTSTQVHIRAGMGKDCYVAERQAAQHLATSYLKEHAAEPVKPQKAVGALALEYVPDHEAYANALTAASRAGFKKIISVNCTDGAMAESHVATLKAHPELEVIATFKYAGQLRDGKMEKALLSNYGPAVVLRENGLKPGGDKPPATLLGEALGRSR